MKYIASFFLIALATIVSAQEVTKPVRIFILAGQSNMEGKAPNALLDYQATNANTKKLFAHLRKDDQWIVRDDVFIKFLERKGPLTVGYGSPGRTGPELEFGTVMGDHFEEPVVLVKAAWGGHSLFKLFRSPSAGFPAEAELDKELKQAQERVAKSNEKNKKNYPLPTMEDIKNPYGSSYRNMMAELKDVMDNSGTMFPALKGRKLELAGFVWFQGWNDMVDSGTYPNRDKPGGYDAYSTVMAHFIRDVRKDLNAPNLPFTIGVLGVGGPTAEYGPDQQRYKATHDNFRAAMAAPAELSEFKGTVAAIRTEKYWDRELTLAKAKDNKIRQRAKQLAMEGKVKPAEERALVEKLRAEGLTERERLVLEKGISNFEFHYLGSAKILGGIGKGLAEAMAELKQLKSSK